MWPHVHMGRLRLHPGPSWRASTGFVKVVDGPRPSAHANRYSGGLNWQFARNWLARGDGWAYCSRCRADRHQSTNVVILAVVTVA